MSCLAVRVKGLPTPPTLGACVRELPKLGTANHTALRVGHRTEGCSQCLLHAFHHPRGARTESAFPGCIITCRFSLGFLCPLS